MRSAVLAMVLVMACGDGSAGGTDGAASGDGAAGDGAVDYGGRVIDFGSARGLVIDGDELIWAKWLAGRVDKRAISDGPITTLHEIDGPSLLAQTAGHTFVLNDWSGDDTVVALADGAPPQVVTTTAGPCCLATTADAVYWRSGATLMTAGPDLVATTVDSNFGLSHFTTVVGDRVVGYFTDTVSLYDMTTQTTTDLHSFGDQLDVKAATSDGSSVYVVTLETPAGSPLEGTVSVWRLGLTPGTPVLLGSMSGQGASSSITMDDDTLYFIRYDTIPYGGVSAIPTAGGTIQPISSNQPAPAAVAVASGTVCWTNVGAGGSADDLNRRGRLMCTDALEAGAVHDGMQVERAASQAMPPAQSASVSHVAVSTHSPAASSQ